MLAREFRERKQTVKQLNKKQQQTNKQQAKTKQNNKQTNEQNNNNNKVNETVRRLRTRPKLCLGFNCSLGCTVYLNRSRQMSRRYLMVLALLAVTTLRRPGNSLFRSEMMTFFFPGKGYPHPCPGRVFEQVEVSVP